MLFAVASVGGIGGGTILIPLLIGMFQFKTKQSIAIASAIVFESSLVRFVFMSAYAGHPDRLNATQIDYNLVRAAFPAFLVGGYFGVLLSVSLGELLPCRAHYDHTHTPLDLSPLQGSQPLQEGVDCHGGSQTVREGVKANGGRVG